MNVDREEAAFDYEVRRYVYDRVMKASGIVHFAIPAAHWWDDIVFN